jgi:hypothetical protein
MSPAEESHAEEQRGLDLHFKLPVRANRITGPEINRAARRRGCEKDARHQERKRRAWPRHRT